jgi:hypothetical protein
MAVRPRTAASAPSVSADVTLERKASVRTANVTLRCLAGLIPRRTWRSTTTAASSSERRTSRLPRGTLSVLVASGLVVGVVDGGTTAAHSLVVVSDDVVVVLVGTDVEVDGSADVDVDVVADVFGVVVPVGGAVVVDPGPGDVVEVVVLVVVATGASARFSIRALGVRVES